MEGEQEYYLMDLGLASVVHHTNLITQKLTLTDTKH